MTTPIFLTGFEYGLATIVANGTGLADSVYNTPEISSTYKNAGSYALRLNSTGTSKYWQKTHTSADYQVGSVYIYFNGALPSADCALVFGINADANFQIYFESTDSKLYAGKVAVAGPVAGPVVTYNTWYRIDWRFYSNSTTHTVDWSVDGSAQTQFSVGSRTAGQITAIRLTTANVTADVFFDDLIISATTGDYPIGAHAVEGLRPSGDGTHNNATDIMEISTGGDIDGVSIKASTYLDDIPWSSTVGGVDYVRQKNNGASYYCEILFTDTTNTTILGAMALLQYDSAATQANEGACIIVDEDATQTEVWGNPTTRADYSESSAFYKSALLPVPAGGWDAAAVNALKCRFGYSNDAAPDPYWEAIMLEVAYKPSIQLTIEDSFHSHKIDDIVLYGTVNYLTVQECFHSHKSEEGLINPNLTIEDSRHAHTAKPVCKSTGEVWATMYNDITSAWTNETNLYAHDTNLASAIANIGGEDTPVNLDSFSALASALPATAEVYKIIIRVYDVTPGTNTTFDGILYLTVDGVYGVWVSVTTTSNQTELSSTKNTTPSSFLTSALLGEGVLGPIFQLNIYGPTASTTTVDGASIEVLYFMPRADLVIEESFHGHAAEEPVLTTSGGGGTNLTVEQCFHSNKSDELKIQPNLVIGESFHAHQGADANVQPNLVIEESFHSHAVDDAPLTKSVTLMIEECFHGHTVDDAPLTKSDTLVTEESRHAQTAEDFILVQLHNLAIEEARHGNVVDELILQPNLLVMEAVHTHTVDELALTKSDTLVVEDSLHSHTVDELNLGGAQDLTIGECFHGHRSEFIYKTIRSYPSATYYIDGTYWTDVSNLYAKDGSTASLVLADGAVGHHGFYNFNFDDLLPAGAKIKKVVFGAEGMYKSGGNSGGSIRLMDGVSNIGDDFWISNWYPSGIGDASGHYFFIESDEDIDTDLYVWTDFTGQGTSGFRITADLWNNISGSTIYADAFWVDIGYIDPLVLTIEDSFHAHTAEDFAVTTQIPLAIQDSFHAHSSTSTQGRTWNWSDGAQSWTFVSISDPSATGSWDNTVGRYTPAGSLKIHRPSGAPAGTYTSEWRLSFSPGFIYKTNFYVLVSFKGTTGGGTTNSVYSIYITTTSGSGSNTSSKLGNFDWTTLVHSPNPIFFGKTVTQIGLRCSYSGDTSTYETNLWWDDITIVMPGDLKLTMNSSLVIEDSYHGHAVEDAPLTKSDTLVIEDSFHTHAVDEISTTKSDTLVVEGCFHSHSSDEINLSGALNLTIEDSLHTHTVEDANLATQIPLAIEELFHAHTADEPKLQPNLVIEQSFHNHTSDGILLTLGSLTIEDCLHTHTADLLDLSGAINLQIGECFHSHTAADANVQQNLIIEDSFHAHTVEEPSLTQLNVLSIEDSFHSHTADQVPIQPNLIIEESFHHHSADEVALLGPAGLTIEDSRHSHTADEVTVTIPVSLVIEDSSHSHTSGRIYKTVRSYPSSLSYFYGPEWTNASNVYAKDGQTASVVLVSGTASIYTLLDFNFDDLLPAGAKIKELVFGAEGMYATATPAGGVFFITTDYRDPYFPHDYFTLSDWYPDGIGPTPRHYFFMESDENLDPDLYFWTDFVTGGADGFRMSVSLSGTSGITVYMDAFYVDISYIDPIVLSIEDSHHSHTVDALIPTPLVIEDSYHAHTPDQPYVTTSALAIKDSRHTNIVDACNVTSFYAQTLVIGDSFHAHTSDRVLPAATQNIIIEDSKHVLVSDLMDWNAINIQDSRHLQHAETAYFITATLVALSLASRLTSLTLGIRDTDLSISERNIEVSLERRAVDLTLSERSTALTLPKKDVS